MREIQLETLRYNEEGLVPVIAQDADTREVLMMAWANQETLAESIATKKMVYFSRSRNQRWMKGETSGNFQEIVSLSQDCDGDAILALVKTHGPACHNGTNSCFLEA